MWIELGRARAEDVHAEQRAVVERDEQLEHAVAVAEDLPAGELAIARDADLVGHAGLGQLLLGLAHERDLGNRVDADRQQGVHRLGRPAERDSAAMRPCSMAVAASAGKPITSPTA